ncbi:MAG: tRNA (adenosine(37)-N6)-threonylcarbamoyltransferase complex transferase subunit TsaD [Candidatus Pacebacteria bacterium]|nr:tRNA (adenosine(37)-N6)-threonylcarbamoyltransferase complex transferase subunit TsaD [Candidatus Paceibacterota bacterium]
MRILAIETSCDETGLAVLDITKQDGQPEFSVVTSELSSQAQFHAQFGGVFPMMAKREHMKNFPALLEHLLETLDVKKTGGTISDEVKSEIETMLTRETELVPWLIDTVSQYEKPPFEYLAVTVGPGLEPALWVGVNIAKALSLIWDIPLIPVNHMEGHFLSVLLTEENGVTKTRPLQYPALALLVSGGHTELVLAKEPLSYEILGKTRDDAVGEAFDKVARLLDLPYPGGPEISKLAESVRGTIEQDPRISLPRPMLHSGDYEFSFSGLKTATLYLIRDLKEEGIEIDDNIKAALACEFENAAIEVLIKKLSQAIDTHNPETIIMGGGVAANKYLRSQFLALSETTRTPAYISDREVSTDNAIMIAIAAYFQTTKNQRVSSLDSIRANGNLKLG